MVEARKKRERVYVLRPRQFDISGCPECDNPDPEWSEYSGLLWCPFCKIDFEPERDGVFGGPIPVQCAEIIGCFFDMIDIATGKLLPDCIGHIHFSPAEDGTLTQIYEPLIHVVDNQVVGIKVDTERISSENEKRTGNHARDTEKQKQEWAAVAVARRTNPKGIQGS